MQLCICLFQPTRTVCWQTRLQLPRANALLTLISTVAFLSPNYEAVTCRTPMSGGVLERSTNALVHASPWLLLMFALICIIQPATLDVASSSLTPLRLACIGNSNYAITFAVTQRPYRFAGTLMKLSTYKLLSYLYSNRIILCSCMPILVRDPLERHQFRLLWGTVPKVHILLDSLGDCSEEPFLPLVAKNDPWHYNSLGLVLMDIDGMFGLFGCWCKPWKDPTNMVIL